MLAELAFKVRNNEVSPVELVEESLRRIEAAKELNAVVYLYADEALEIARTHQRNGKVAGLP
jgi:Asp-tRNA(Asn)/Glu-tRNA(Gln) amidotransferase A subunit family amidase